MPTKRPRHGLTETDQVARAIDAAAKRWPHDSDSRTKLLVRLVEEGHRFLVEQEGERLAARRSAIEQTSGTFAGVYGAGYLAELREDWWE